MARRPPPKIVVRRHEEYRTIFESGIYGGGRPGYIEYVIYTDEMAPDEALSTLPPDPAKTQISRTIQCLVRLTPFEAKGLAEWLNRHLAQYEKTFGKIPTPKDLAEKGQKAPPTGMIT